MAQKSSFILSNIHDEGLEARYQFLQHSFESMIVIPWQQIVNVACQATSC